MANTIYDTTNRVRIKPGLIYDLQCELMTEHSNIIARIIHDSNIDEENIFVPIKFTHRWATVSPESDYDEIAGWACRLYRDLPADHPYGSGKIYDPDEATLKRLLIPGKMDTNLADHTILQLLHDFYVSNPDHTISAISIFMSLEIEKDQLFERLNYIHKREWIKLSGSNSNKWLLKYSISPQAIEKIEERLIS